MVNQPCATAAAAEHLPQKGMQLLLIPCCVPLSTACVHASQEQHSHRTQDLDHTGKRARAAHKISAPEVSTLCHRSCSKAPTTKGMHMQLRATSLLAMLHAQGQEQQHGSTTQAA